MTLATDLKPIIDAEHPAGPTVVKLSRIRTDYFENYRSDLNGIHGEDIKELRQNLNEMGQLQNVIGTWLEDGTVALNAGFRRVTAMRMNCLEDLVNKYNKDNKLKTGDEQYIKPWKADFYNRILEVRPNEARKLLDDFPVKVDIREFKDDVDAMLVNGAENEARLDVPLSDTLMLIARLKARKVKQSKIAIGLGKSDSTISQMVKVIGLPADIKEFLLSDETVKTMGLDDTTEKVHLLQVKGLLDEYQIRINLPKGEDRSIPFSHLRDLSNAVVTKAGCALEPKQLVEALQYLLKYSDKPLGAPTPEYGQFKTKLTDLINLSNSIRKERELEKERKSKPQPPASSPPVTLDDLSKKQEELKSAGQEVKTTKAEAAEQTLDDLVAGSGIDSADIADDEDDVDIDSLIDETEEALSGSGFDEVEVESVDDEDFDVPKDEDLEAIAEEEDDTPATAGEAGITTSKTRVMDKPASKYKQRSPEDTHKLATSVILMNAEDADLSIFERLAALQTSAFLLDSIGMEAERKKIDDVYEEYLNSCVIYLKWLIDCAKEHAPEKIKAPIMSIEGLKGIK